MGAGKSTTGRRIARRLETGFADTDELIAAEAGRPLATLFATEGEAKFRELEERVVLSALGRGGVVALGGGAVESEGVRAALRDHLTVWCTIDEDLAWARCSGSDRPLARNREGFRGRFRARAPLYEEVADVVLPTDADVDPRRPGSTPSGGCRGPSSPGPSPPPPSTRRWSAPARPGSVTPPAG